MRLDTQDAPHTEIEKNDFVRHGLYCSPCRRNETLGILYSYYFLGSVFSNIFIVLESDDIPYPLTKIPFVPTLDSIA